MDYKTMTLDLIDSKFDSSKKKLDDTFDYLKEISADNNRKIVLFGAGAAGKDIFNCLHNNNIKVDYFCDETSSKIGTKIINNIVCISTEVLKKMCNNAIVIISIGTNNKEIIKKIKKIGTKEIISNALEMLHVRKNEIYTYSKESVKENISKLFDILGDEHSKYIVYKKIFAMLADMEDLSNFNYDDIYTMPQYFENIKLNHNQCIIDCGAFTGDSLQSFLNIYNQDILDRYICYELDKINYDILLRYVDKLSIKDKVNCFNLGVDKNTKNIKYVGGFGGNSHINNVGNMTGRVVDMDYHLYNTYGKKCKPTFIKMDIEGAEIDALLGAKRIIKSNKPICAISNYHKSNHLWDIPFLLKKLVPKYRIYFRHHTNTYADTICYAVLEG